MISCFADEISPLLSDQLNMLNELDIEAMELRSMWGVNVLELSALQLKDIAQTVHSAGKSISCISSPIGKCPYHYPMEETAKQLAVAIAAAQICDCSRIRIFSWQVEENERTEKTIYETAERLKTLTDMASSEGMYLVMENSAVGTGNTGENCANLVELVNSPHLSVAFDPASFVCAGERPFDQSYPAVKDYVGYVHIKDVKKGEDRRTVAGEGDGQLPELIREFAKNPELCLSLEPHLSYFGHAGGFSGPDNFRKAHFALKKYLNVFQKETNYGKN